MNYIDKTKPVASSRIIPWLKPEKYSFAIISEANLDIMRETKMWMPTNAYSKKLCPENSEKILWRPACVQVATFLASHPCTASLCAA